MINEPNSEIKEVLRICPNGDIIHKGKTIEADDEIRDLMKQYVKQLLSHDS